VGWESKKGRGFKKVLGKGKRKKQTKLKN